MSHQSSSSSLRSVTFLFLVWSLVGCSAKPIKTVVITGSTGVIGKALAQQVIRIKDIETFIAGRDEERLRTLFNDLISDTQAVPMTNILRSDFNCERSLSTLSLPLLYTTKSRNAMLINNAGIYIPGNSVESLERSLRVNCVGPARLSELFIQSMRDRLFIDANMITCTNNDDATNMKPLEGTIVNISSGEGELVLLNSRMQEELQRIESYMVRLAILRAENRHCTNCRSPSPRTTISS
jgi:short-subunit dehydrogenase